MTQEEISRQVAKSRSVVANALRLLSLPDDILKYIEASELSAGHARALLSLDDPEEQIKLTEKIITGGLSVREIEKIARTIKEKRNSVSNPEINESEENDEKNTNTQNPVKIGEAYIKNLQNKISDIFGKKVIINTNGKDDLQSGKLEIEYKTNEELEFIIKTLCGDKNIFEN